MSTRRYYNNMTTITHDDLRGLEEKINKMAVTVQEVKGLIMPRAEIEGALNQRVSLDAARGIEERLARLEQSPQRQVAWYAVGISGAVGCASLLFMLIGGLISIASIIVSLLK